MVSITRGAGALRPMPCTRREVNNSKRRTEDGENLSFGASSLLGCIAFAFTNPMRWPRSAAQELRNCLFPALPLSSATFGVCPLSVLVVRRCCGALCSVSHVARVVLAAQPAAAPSRLSQACSCETRARSPGLGALVPTLQSTIATIARSQFKRGSTDICGLFGVIHVRGLGNLCKDGG